MARDELVRRYLPLARKLATRYRNPNEPSEDLIQVASVGLIKAVDRYRVEHGNAFSSYAVPTILGELRRHFRDTGWSVHVPRGAKELAQRVQTGAQQLTDQSGRSPSVPELAQFLELSVEDALDGLLAAGAHYSKSLDAPAIRSGADDDEQDLLDTIGSQDGGYEFIEAIADIAAGMRTLPAQERRALALRLRSDLTQAEIAERMGCSQMQVSRLLARATARLRAFAAAD